MSGSGRNATPIVSREYRSTPDDCARALELLLEKSVSKAARPAPSLTTATERLKVIPPMNPLYGTNPHPRDSQDILPMLRDLFSKHPEYRHHEPYELQSLLWSLRYTDELLDEDEIAAAAQVARTDFDPDEGAA
jgi:hypothetical protein